MTRRNCYTKVGHNALLLEHCWAAVETEVIIGTHCASVASDQIIAAIIYMIYPEEHLWNIIILQRVHLSSLI
jgi:hypothetical protein